MKVYRLTQIEGIELKAIWKVLKLLHPEEIQLIYNF